MPVLRQSDGFSSEGKKRLNSSLFMEAYFQDCRTRVGALRAPRETPSRAVCEGRSCVFPVALTARWTRIGIFRLGHDRDENSTDLLLSRAEGSTHQTVARLRSLTIFSITLLASFSSPRCLGAPFSLPASPSRDYPKNTFHPLQNPCQIHRSEGSRLRSASTVTPPHRKAHCEPLIPSQHTPQMSLVVVVVLGPA